MFDRRMGIKAPEPCSVHVVPRDDAVQRSVHVNDDEGPQAHGVGRKGRPAIRPAHPLPIVRRSIEGMVRKTDVAGADRLIEELPAVGHKDIRVRIVIVRGDHSAAQDRLIEHPLRITVEVPVLDVLIVPLGVRVTEDHRD